MRDKESRIRIANIIGFVLNMFLLFLGSYSIIFTGVNNINSFAMVLGFALSVYFVIEVLK